MYTAHTWHYPEQLWRLGAQVLGKVGEELLLPSRLLSGDRSGVREGLSVRVQLLASWWSPELEGIAEGEGLDRHQCSREEDLQGI